MTKPFIVFLVLLSHFWLYGADPFPPNETREERVRYEILTLNAFARMIENIQTDRTAAWPMAWHETEESFWSAARKVVNLDSEGLANSVVSDPISDCLFDLPLAAYKFIRENEKENRRFVILGVWRIIISYEPVMQRGSRKWFQSISAPLRKKDPNATLYLAIETLRNIPFERSQKTLLEIQTFLALRTLRCLYLWDPQYTAIKIEEFAVMGLYEVLPIASYLKLVGNPSKPLNNLVLNDEWLGEATTEIFSSR